MSGVSTERSSNAPRGPRATARPRSCQWKPSLLVAYHTSPRSQSHTGTVSPAPSKPAGGAERRRVYHTYQVSPTRITLLGSRRLTPGCLPMPVTGAYLNAEKNSLA